MVDIAFVHGWGEIMKIEEDNREMADLLVRPAQANIGPSQHYINAKYGRELPIFGRILDIRTLGDSPKEQKYVDEVYAQPHMRYYRPAEVFSADCEEGECGDIHLSEVHAIIDKELFDWYRDNGWRKPR